MTSKLPEVPKVTPEGRRIYRIRCATCADVRPTITVTRTLIYPRGSLVPRSVTSIDTGLVCQAPPVNRFIDLDGQVYIPPTGEVVEKRNYCDFWRRRSSLKPAKKP